MESCAICDKLRERIELYDRYIESLKETILAHKKVIRAWEENNDKVIDKINKRWQESMKALSDAAFHVIDEQRAEISQLKQ